MITIIVTRGGAEVAACATWEAAVAAVRLLGAHDGGYPAFEVPQ